jgi:hypothetical protein
MVTPSECHPFLLDAQLTQHPTVLKGQLLLAERGNYVCTLGRPYELIPNVCTYVLPVKHTHINKRTDIQT